MYRWMSDLDVIVSVLLLIAFLAVIVMIAVLVNIASYIVLTQNADRTVSARLTTGLWATK